MVWTIWNIKRSSMHVRKNPTHAWQLCQKAVWVICVRESCPGSSAGKALARYMKSPWLDYWLGRFFSEDFEIFRSYDFIINRFDWRKNKNALLFLLCLTKLSLNLHRCILLLFWLTADCVKKRLIAYGLY